MTTYNTGNPVGSVDVRDLYDNAENLDKFTNGQLDEYADRLGVSRQSLQGIRNASQYVDLGPYAAGLNFTSRNQVFSYNPGTGAEFYAPGPAITLPYTTTGAGAGEIANFRSVGDAILRADLANDTDPAKGAGLIGYRGRPLSTKLDTAKCFRDYGAVGDGVTDDTVAILAAISENKYLALSPGKYICKQNLIFDGHTLTSLGTTPEYYGQHDASTVQIIFETVTGDAVTNEGSLTSIRGIWFRQASWAAQLNGLNQKRYIYAVDCLFTEFNGYGQHSSASAGEAGNPYHSVFERCQFLFNAKHGVAVLNGSNAITYRDCMGRWNGSPSRGVQPTVAGSWDGLYVDGRFAGIPDSPTPVEPQVILVEGGDWSYNSRYGQNWHRAFDSALIGGYIELNLVNDLRIGGVFGTVILNPMAMSSPLLEVVNIDPIYPEQNLANYPNHIIIRGRKYGEGIRQGSGGLKAYRELLGSMYTVGSESEARIVSAPSGAIHLESDTYQAVRSNSTLAVCLKKFRLGVGIGDEATTPGGVDINYIAPMNGLAQGNRYFRFLTDAPSQGEIFAATGTNGSEALTFLRAPANSITGRSINAGGTVNASGADYAEYMRKAPGCGTIPKGAICGVTSRGELTDIYDCAIAFVVKSTDPAYVGGDTWSLPTQRPDQPDQDATAEEQQAQRAALEDFGIELEALRQRHDRIAFAGQVPVSVMLAQPGDYIVPVRGENGGIGGEAISSPTFEQFRNSVGRVWKVQDDGRAWIVVKPC